MEDKFVSGDKCGLTKEKALQLAAAAWCGENTKNKVMDPELAKEFAKILQREVAVGIFRYRISRSNLMSTYGVRAAKKYEELIDESLKLMEDAEKVYRMTRGKAIPFEPEQIIHMKIGDDRKSFDPYEMEKYAP